MDCVWADCSVFTWTTGGVADIMRVWLHNRYRSILLTGIFRKQIVKNTWKPHADFSNAPHLAGTGDGHDDCNSKQLVQVVDAAGEFNLVAAAFRAYWLAWHINQLFWTLLVFIHPV